MFAESWDHKVFKMPSYKVNDTETYERNGTYNNFGYKHDRNSKEDKSFEDNLPSYSGSWFVFFLSINLLKLYIASVLFSHSI